MWRERRRRKKEEHILNQEEADRERERILVQVGAEERGEERNIIIGSECNDIDKEPNSFNIAPLPLSPIRIKNRSPVLCIDSGEIRKINLCFGITNARSLWKKLPSLADHFEDLELDFAIITETWFYKTPALDKLVCDADREHNLGMINNIRTRRGRLNIGGGVSIVYNKKRINCTELNVKRSGHEIAVARLKIKNESRPIIVIGTYLSTRLTRPQAEVGVKTLSAIIGKFKTELDNPRIVLGGDFNGFSTGTIRDDYPDLEIHLTPPTRGNRTIDLALTNIESSITRSQVLPPLRNDESETESDHRFVVFNAAWKHSHRFTWIRTRGRQLSQENVERCIEEINRYDWTSLADTDMTPTALAKRLHDTLCSIADRTIPWKTYKRRSTDDPWIDDKIRKMIARRRAVFRNKGRNSKDWKELKAKTDEMIARAKRKWYEEEANRLMQRGSNQIAYRALGRLGGVEGSEIWDVMDMRPGGSQQQVAEELAEHYSAISNEFPPLNQEEIPITYDRQVFDISEGSIAERLAALKKPKSYVTIDLPPRIVSETAGAVAPLVAKIINKVMKGEGWPELWSSEEVTTIPKTSRPETLDQCRGISCTSIYSKLAESYMLDMMREEISINCNQFGGLRGVGTDHLLVDMSNRILEDLDDNRGAVSVISIDYAKAFNRMDHAHCLRAMAAKGSSTQAIRIAASFLSDRVIRTKVGEHLSKPRKVPGGAPQGTKSGNFFFTVSIDEIENRINETRQDHTVNDNADLNAQLPCYRPPLRQPLTSEEDTTFDSERSLNVARADHRILKRYPTHVLDETPIEILASQEEHEEASGFPPRWDPKGPWTVKFVDDVTLGGKNLLDHAVRHVTTAKEKRLVHAGDLETKYEQIVKNSTRIGMVVNPRKTQIMCVSQSINYDVSSYINIGGEKRWSEDSMKVLGFHFDSKCNMSVHIGEIKKKFAKRLWIIRHLKRVQIPIEKLIRIYCALVRPLFDYASVVYHSMLTANQTNDLERLQANALRTIFGWNKSYRECLAKSKLETLHARRYDACKSFAAKNVSNARFPHWFPENAAPAYALRNTERYKVTFARHERLRNSPIHFMRRILNDQEDAVPLEGGVMDNTI